MSEQPFDPSSVSPPSVPPTQAGPLPTATPPSTWPTVIGVIAIVFGVGGIMNMLISLVPLLFADKFAELVGKEQAASMQAAQENRSLLLGLALLALVLAVILLVGGIGVTKRRFWGVKACRTWAILKILLVLINLGATYHIQKENLANMKQQMPPGTSEAFMIGIIVGSVCFGLIWSFALPVFMLIWFSRARIKEEIKGWELEAGNPYRPDVR